MFWKKLWCLIRGHDEKLSIDRCEPHPRGGFMVTQSHRFCGRCKQRLV